MSLREEIKKELESLDSSLKFPPSGTDFDIPEGYFTSLQDNVFQIWDEQDEKGPKTRLLSFASRYGLNAAAAVFLLALAVLWGIESFGSERSGWEEISTQELYSYLDAELESIPAEWLLTIGDESLLSDWPLSDHEKIDTYIEDQLEDISIEQLENLL